MKRLIASEFDREILDALPHPVILLDRAFRVLLLNSEAGNLLGMPIGDLLGQALWDLFPPGRSSTLERDFEQAFREGRRVHLRYFYPLKERWFDVTAKPDSEGALW